MKSITNLLLIKSKILNQIPKKKSFYIDFTIIFIFFLINVFNIKAYTQTIDIADVGGGDYVLETKDKVEVTWRLISDFQRDEAPCWGWTYHIWIRNGFNYSITIDKNEAYQDKSDFTDCWQSGSIKFGPIIVLANKYLWLTFRVYSGKSGKPGSPGLVHSISWNNSNINLDDVIIGCPDCPDISGTWSATYTMFNDEPPHTDYMNIKQNGKLITATKTYKDKTSNYKGEFIDKNSFYLYLTDPIYKEVFNITNGGTMLTTNTGANILNWYKK